MRQSKDSLLQFTRTENEKMVVQAGLAVALKNISSEDDISVLIEVVGQWAYYLGISKTLTSDDILLMCNYLRETHGELTAEDIRLAFKLQLKGVMGEAEFYGQLSPLYASKVLNNYSAFRADALQEVLKRKDVADQPEAQKMSSEQSLIFMKEVIASDYTHFQKTGKVLDHFSLIYDFLKKTKRITVDPEIIAEAEEYAKGCIIQNRTREDITSIGGNIEQAMTPNEEIAKKRYCRRYCVQKYFLTVDIEALLASIKLGEAD